MSTILKALRQSEARRSRHARLSPAPDPRERPGPGPRDLAWLGVAVLAFGAVAGAVWFATGRDAPEQPGRAERPARIAQVSLPQVRGPATPDRSRPAPEEPAPAPGDGEARVAAAEDETRPAPSPPEPAAAARVPDRPATRKPADEPPPTPRLDEFPLLPRLRDLAPDRRQRLPELALNAHIYAENPKDRFVLIDLTRYREGDRIGPELRVTAIFAGGVVIEDATGTFVLPRP